jgi:hypothetical protein
LYNYRTIPEEWTCFFKERKSPDIPENISDQKRITETTYTAFLDQQQPKKRAKTKKDTRTSYQKYLHWQKSRPNICTSTRNVFSKLYYTSNKVAARYINSHLERQSDRDIPKLFYRSGMTVLSKMSGQGKKFPDYVG